MGCASSIGTQEDARGTEAEFRLEPEANDSTTHVNVRVASVTLSGRPGSGDPSTPQLTPKKSRSEASLGPSRSVTSSPLDSSSSGSTPATPVTTSAVILSAGSSPPRPGSGTTGSEVATFAPLPGGQMAPFSAIGRKRNAPTGEFVLPPSIVLESQESGDFSGFGDPSNAQELVTALSSYVPIMVVRYFVENPELTLSKPIALEFQAALLFLDVSGFTPLTEKLCKIGKIGAELISKHLNMYFGKLIAMINQYGGDIMKFAGDALFVVFPTDRGDDLPRAVFRAAQCALAIQERLNEYRPVEDVVLRLHSCVTAGDLYAMHVGYKRRWEFLFMGAPLTQIRYLEEHSKVGYTVVPSDAWDLIKDSFNGEDLAPGVVLLQNVKPGCELPTRRVELPPLAPALRDNLSCYVPSIVLPRLQAQTRWLGELRRVTVLFIKAPDYSFSSDAERAETLMKLNDIMTIVGEITQRYEGTVRQYIVDDKGTVLITVFGLPMQSHEDDAARGVKAALETASVFDQLSIAYSIGLTTGTAFCGSVGSPDRCEYSVVGDIVNLSARLMGVAYKLPTADGARGNVICDLATATAAGSRGRMSFETLPPQKLKGKEKPTAVFRPLGTSHTATVAQDTFVGRVAELNTIRDTTIQQVERNKGRTLLVEAEAGMGKTRLAAEAVRIARQLSVTCLTGCAEASERNTAFFIFRTVFEQLCQSLLAKARGNYLLKLLTAGKAASLSAESVAIVQNKEFEQIAAYSIGELIRVRRSQVMTPAEKQAAVRVLTARFRYARIIRDLNPELLKYLPLSDVVLDIAFPETTTTRKLGPDERLAATKKFLVDLLATFEKSCGRLTVVLDDVHWMDAVSWDIVVALRRRIPSVVLMLATRPTGHPTKAHQEIAEDSATAKMNLGFVSQEEAKEIIAQSLGLAPVMVPQVVVDIIAGKAQGNPLFIEELTRTLRESGNLDITAGKCRVDAATLEKMSFPDSIQGVITNRIDKLSSENQMLIKCASVIGKLFSQRLCMHICPVKISPENFKELESRDFLRCVPGPAQVGDKLYMFTSIVMLEVAYDMLLFSQKSTLHNLTASWYEDKHSNDLSPHYSTLAFHIIRAVEYEDAVAQNVKLVQRALFYIAKVLEKMPMSDDAERQELTRKSEQFLKLLPKERRAEKEIELQAAQAAAFL